MNPEASDLSEMQLEFLATMAALNEPTSIDILGHLVPLTPGPLLELIRLAQDLKWIGEDKAGHFYLRSNLPKKIVHAMTRINNTAHIKKMVNKLTESGRFLQLSKTCRSNLLECIDHNLEALQLKMEIAHEQFIENRPASGLALLHEISLLLSATPDEIITETWFINSALELTQACISYGTGFPNCIGVLERSLAAAAAMGDQRNWALINLHLGQLYYVSDKRARALSALTAGKQKVEELGDSDILEQSDEFIGLYYAICGLMRQATHHLEKAVKADTVSEKEYINPLSPLTLAYCEAYLGRFHKAIGCLDFHWHIARRSHKPAIAATMRAALGTILLHISNRKEALRHLRAARKQAVSGDYPFAAYLAVGGLAYHHFLEGNIQKTYELFRANLENAERAGIVRQYSSPWVLEIIFEFDQIGLDEMPGWAFDDFYKKSMQDPNIHIRGVALRLKARAMLLAGQDKKRILKILLESKRYLKQAGDPIQLAKTRLELAQLKLKENNLLDARKLARQARQGLAGNWEDFFPDGLRKLLDPRSPGIAAAPDKNPDSIPDILTRFLEVIDDVLPKPNLNDILDQLVSALNRFFMAERGALFWFDKRSIGKPVLRAGRNIHPGDVETDSFQSSLKLVSRCFREKRPLVLRPTQGGHNGELAHFLSILCIPVEAGGRIHGVFYFDNSYINNCFDFATDAVLTVLKRHMTSIVEKLLKYSQLLEDAEQTQFERSVPLEDHSNDEFLFQSSIMVRTITKADRMAKSGASILLLGETGVGKEVLATWIHHHSHRSQGPFIIVDPTTIPEHLIESELFGHEKGAFTGAERQKRGRLELAHKGTLFIDEVGEIPLHLQSKFLRVLQEKSFSRVGGTRTIRSNFRLITATNRDLSAEIVSGRFREDLFYRINVLELTIPPLRNRPEDIWLLTRHFIDKYARRNNYPAPVLDKESIKKLKTYHWPGNVRELKNLTERSVLLSSGRRMELDLPSQSGFDHANPFADLPKMEEIQRRYIAYVLEKTNGKVSGDNGAAKLLGMKRTTLHSRIKRLGMAADLDTFR